MSDLTAADRRRQAEKVERETGVASPELRASRIIRKHVGRGSYIPAGEAMACAEDVIAAVRPLIEAEVLHAAATDAPHIWPKVFADWLRDRAEHPPVPDTSTDTDRSEVEGLRAAAAELRELAAKRTAEAARIDPNWKPTTFVDADWLDARANRIERGGASDA